MRKHSVSVTILAWLAIGSLVAVGGCGPQRVDGRVVARSNQDIAALDADDIVRVMLRAGFSEPEILEFGADLRNSLSSTGAAHIVADGNVEAILAVDGERLHVASRRRGSFIYDLTQQSFRAPPPSKADRKAVSLKVRSLRD